MGTVKSVLTRNYEVQMFREWDDNLLFYSVVTGLPSQTPTVVFRTLTYEDASELFDDTAENLNQMFSKGK